MKTSPQIREISVLLHARAAAEVIRRAFATVAQEYGFTRENFPSHRAFQTASGLVRDLCRLRCHCFGLYADGRLVGFAALRPTHTGNEVELTRLAVLPKSRHHGYGKMLVDAVAEKARKVGETRLIIGVNNDDERLKAWYKAYGFTEFSVKQFAHIPMAACYMELTV